MCAADRGISLLGVHKRLETFSIAAIAGVLFGLASHVSHLYGLASIR